MGGSRRATRLSATAAAVAVAAALLASLGPAGDVSAQSSDQCLQADPPPITAPPHRLRFGITPLAAGNASLSQGQPKPENRAAALAALQKLRPGRRQLILRLNRMFMADGVGAIYRYAGIVDHYAAARFDSELQVRYHPGPGQEGNMAAWEAFVREAARVLGKRPNVKALTVVNEGNLAGSPNTSDGAYAGVRQAIVVGIKAARDQLDRIGRPDVQLGFSYAWRYLPNSDVSFWQELGARGDAEFRRALDYVGVQAYPGLFWPPVLPPGRTAGEELIEALTLVRHCYMPKARLGDGVDIWVTENGYATNLGRSEASQDADLRSTIGQVHAYSGTLGISDYRWFNLRDNNSQGTDLFDAVGLLRDDYSEKPAFWTFRDAIDRLGVDRPRRRLCGRRVAILVGTPAAERLQGSIGPDVIVTRGGRDRIEGGPGDDLICAGRGRDRVRGGDDADRLLGNKGRDRLRGEAGDDRLRGGAGRDRLHGGPGRDRCPRSVGRDRRRSCR